MMKNKVAIITGVQGNLGSGIAKKLTSEGIQVVGTIHKKKNNESPQQSPSLLKEIVIDLLDEQHTAQLVESVIAQHNHIDIAVLTAGGFAMGDLSRTNASDVLSQYRLNFETAYNIARPIFLQMMKQNSGRIFLTGAQAGLDVHNAEGTIAYALAKSLLFKLAELMNKEAKNNNVVVSVLVPSIIDTPQNRASMPDSDFSQWVSPTQIADVVYYYCTEEAQHLKAPIIRF